MEEALNNRNENKKIVRSIIDDDRRAPYPKECPECGSTNIVNNPVGAEIYCGDCGRVIEENMIDPGPEWRILDIDDRDKKWKKIRTGPPTTNYHIDSKRRFIPFREIEEIGVHNHRIQSRLRTQIEKSLDYATGEIERIANSLKLPKNLEKETEELYRKATKEKLTRGHNIDEIIPAMLYSVCKKTGNPRTFREIAEVSRADKNKIEKTCSFLIRNKEKIGLGLFLSYPWEYIPGFCSKLRLSEAVKTKAIEITKKVYDAEINIGSKPTTIAGAAIGIAIDLCNEKHRTKEKIVEVCGMTATTLLSSRKKIEKALKIEIPNKKNKKTTGRN